MKIVSFFESLKIGWWVEKVQATVGTGLSDQWHEIIYLVLEDRKPRNTHKWRIMSLDEPFILGFGIMKIIALFRLGKKVANFCRIEQVDVILGQWDFFFMVVAMSKWIFNNKSKCIGVVHTTIGIWPIYVTKILIFLLKKLDKVILISHKEYNTFINEYWFTKWQLQIIYNSINTEEISLKSTELVPTEYTNLFNNSKFTYINIGRMTDQKNQSLLLDAFDKINSIYPNTQLIILGDGELKKTLEQQRINLSAAFDIHFLGNQANVFPFLKESDCFVLSSKFEGFPMVLLEVAYCASCPIISTNCPTGPNELISKEFLVNFSEDITQELAYKMEEIYLWKLSIPQAILKNKEKSLLFDDKKIKKKWKRYISAL